MTLRILTLAAACAATTASAQPADLIPVTFTCERGVEVPVVFVNSESGESYAVALIDGRMLGMRRAVSASGARYRSGDGADAYELWTKGNTAMVSVGADGNDTVLFQDCAGQQ